MSKSLTIRRAGPADAERFLAFTRTAGAETDYLSFGPEGLDMTLLEVTDMLSRLETMVLQGAAGLPLEAIRQQIASAVDIIIHLSRLRDKSRKTMEITEVVGYENGKIILNPLYVFEEDKYSTMEKVSGSLNRTKNKMVNDFKLRLSGVKTEI